MLFDIKFDDNQPFQCGSIPKHQMQHYHQWWLVSFESWSIPSATDLTFILSNAAQHFCTCCYTSSPYRSQCLRFPENLISISIASATGPSFQSNSFTLVTLRFCSVFGCFATHYAEGWQSAPIPPVPSSFDCLSCFLSGHWIFIHFYFLSFWGF